MVNVGNNGNIAKFFDHLRKPQTDFQLRRGWQGRAL
jgi:hypothetical protein